MVLYLCEHNVVYVFVLTPALHSWPTMHNAVKGQILIQLQNLLKQFLVTKPNWKVRKVKGNENSTKVPKGTKIKHSKLRSSSHKCALCCSLKEFLKSYLLTRHSVYFARERLENIYFCVLPVIYFQITKLREVIWITQTNVVLVLSHTWINGEWSTGRVSGTS